VGVFDVYIVVHGSLGQIHDHRVGPIHVSPQCGSPEPDTTNVYVFVLQDDDIVRHVALNEVPGLGVLNTIVFVVAKHIQYSVVLTQLFVHESVVDFGVGAAPLPVTGLKDVTCHDQEVTTGQV
jgi:hypothetical protein